MNMQVIFRTHREIPEMCLRRSNEESLLICIIDYYRNITYKGGCDSSSDRIIVTKKIMIMLDHDHSSDPANMCDDGS